MILVLGVTASGKGRLAFDLARAIGAEVISIDSMKVYRRMDIGTAKPPKQALQRIKHHLIDIVEPSESFSVAAFLDRCLCAIEQINPVRSKTSTSNGVKSRNKPIVAVGGSALYIKALLYGLFEGPPANEQIRNQLRQRAEDEGPEQLYRELAKIDSATAERISPNDSRRIIRALEVYKTTGKPISTLQTQWNFRSPATSNERRATRYDWTIIGLRREKADTNSQINKRVKKMIGQGFIDEVKSLLAEDKPLSQQARCAIGYAEIIDHLNAKISLKDATELIKKNTRRLAKNQRTWFKTFKNVRWLDIEPEESAEEIFSRAETLLSNIVSHFINNATM